jgi:GWxTD domain-containing protein
VALAAALLFMSGSLTAQRTGSADAPGTSDVPVYYDAVVLPSTALDSFRVDIHYRIPAAFFVFLRTPDGHATAQGELLVELASKAGTQTRRDVRPIVIRRDREPAAGETLPDVQDLVRFVVPSGSYSIVFELKAFDSERRFLERRRTLEILPSSNLSAVPRPLFGYPSTDGNHFVPFNRGGAAVFGSRGGMIVHARLPAEGPVAVNWRITNPDVRDGRSVDLRARDTIRLVRTLTTSERSEGIRYRFDSSAVEGWASAFLPLPLEQLEPGPYAVELDLSAGAERSRQIYRFAVIWPTLPRSLADFDLAVDALRHIADPEEIDDMVGFFADGGRARFDEFWRQKDPDTTTVYNPVQEEYYRRVDEAIRRFSTRGGMDGYKTDRGRVLILYGTPTSSQRLFRPNTGPREIWIYEQLKKRFIFTDPSRTGDYTLTQTEEL